MANSKDLSKGKKFKAALSLFIGLIILLTTLWSLKSGGEYEHMMRANEALQSNRPGLRIIRFADADFKYVDVIDHHDKGFYVFSFSIGLIIVFFGLYKLRVIEKANK